jgi:hypothetical protein
MDSKELRGLCEAYSEVYAPQQIDELSNRKLRAYIKKSDKSHTELNKKWDQGTATYQDKYKSINRERGQQRALDTLEKRARKEDLDIFDVVLEFLQAEGFAETLEEAEWLMANMIDEEAIDIILGEGNPIARFLSNRKHRLRDTEKGHEDIMRRNKEYQTKGKGPGGYRNKGAGRVEKVREEYVDEAIYSEKGKAKAAEMIAARSTPSGRAKSGKGADVAHIRQIRGSGRGDFDREGLGGTPMTPTMAKNPIKKQNYIGTGNKAARRAAALKNEEFELWVDALVEEGYNLSGYTWDEMFEIYLDEAQEARNNPEKYEREQSKKYAPARGEKTPMPPRGNKRREDFEKWYAKQMGR